MKRILAGVLSALISVAAAAALPEAAHAVPERVIILRHGEKKNDYALCSIGEERAKALAAQYLSRDHAKTLFAHQPPVAFMSITLHTLELVSPSAGKWGIPVDDVSVMPEPRRDDPKFVEKLNQRTQEAAHEVLTDPRWNGRTVVMVWEHHHIADAKMEKQFPGEEVTLRQLLNLDKLKDVPKTWPNSNYDYFWIVDYGDPKSDVPTAFHMVKQAFEPPYNTLPSNDWGAPEVFPPGSDCEHRK